MARVLRLVSIVATSLSLCGCILPGDGPSPPLDQFYFPTGMALSSDASRLYVANSDFDLQYNQGTLLAVDIKSAQDKYEPIYCNDDGPPCPTGLVCDGTQRPGKVAPSHWCVKKLDEPCGELGEKTAAERLLFPGRCNPIALPSFVKGSAQINAFASDLIFRPLPNELDPPPTGTVPDPGFQEKKGRIFVTVRGNESLTFADVDSNDPEDPIAELRCGETSFGGKCSKVYSRGEEGDDRDKNDRFTDLPPEPNAVAANLRGEVLVVAHQTQPTSSLFINDWLKWGEAGASTGPQLKFLAGGLPENAIDVISMPEPRYMLEHEVDYRPAFLLTFRTAAQLVSLRYFADDSETEPSRPFLTVGGRVDITANSVNWDSRGIAIDTDARTQCETACDPPLPDPPPEPPPVPPTPEELKSCLRTCTNVPLGVFVANRTPSSLLIGQTRPNATPTSNDDLPQIYDSIPLSTGPSRVVTGQIRVADPEFPDDPKKFKAATRVFVVCFDSRLIYIYDPTLQRIESIIRTGRGPYALSIGRILDATTRASEPTGLGYVGMFTDSYVGVVDLDQRHKETYGTIIMTLGNPVVPRASE